jgi:hypothetical protein
METSLHRQLKLHYARTAEQIEVVVDGFRIDAIGPRGELVEIQHASLGALRDKAKKLLDGTKHKLRIVKPIVARKRIVTLTERDGEVIRSRMSPKRGELLDLFQHLVHFSTVFPLKRLTLEVVLIEAEEVRIDRVVAKRRRGKRYITIDQRLTSVQASVELRTLKDLLNLLPLEGLPATFDTAELAQAIERPRWFAQKVGYCLRTTGAAELAGKRGNSQLYRLLKKRRRDLAA